MIHFKSYIFILTLILFLTSLANFSKVFQKDLLDGSTKSSSTYSEYVSSKIQEDGNNSRRLETVCRADGVIGQTYLFPIWDQCYQVEFFEGGYIDVHNGNAGCASTFISSSTLSIFNDYSGGVVNFIPGTENISVTITRESNLFTNELRSLIFNDETDTWEAKLVFPSCPEPDPSAVPSYISSAKPSEDPSKEPSGEPSSVPTIAPSAVPSVEPSSFPNTMSSTAPSITPSLTYSSVPTNSQNFSPSNQPSSKPSDTQKPSRAADFEWKQLGADVTGESAGDNSGSSVSLSQDGSRIAIGAFGNDDKGRNTGHVRVLQFREGDGTWVQLGGDIDGESTGDYSGSSVSLSQDGTTVAIGATLNDGNGRSAGHVRLFRFSEVANDWVQLGEDIDGEATSDYFGSSVSLSQDGTRVAVGAYGNDGNGSNAGHVRVFELNGSNTWVPLGGDIDGEGENDGSGRSISLSKDGTIVAIGATGNDDNGSNSGHVRIFELDEESNIWVKLGEDIDGEATGDGSGCSVSLSEDGTRVAIGATGNDGNGAFAGHARIFQFYREINTWVQLGGDIEGSAPDNFFGWSVSLSSDGARVAIGAPYNAENGNNSGQIHVLEFSNISNQWLRVGEAINGGAGNDYFGKSISLSKDGSIVAIGAHGNDDNGTNAGHVQVYHLTLSQS